MSSHISLELSAILAAARKRRRVARSEFQFRPLTVTASRSLAGSPPENAVDGNPDTSWNAGAVAPQWIQLDFGQVLPIGRVKLVVDQLPAGSATYNISVGEQEGQLRLVLHTEIAVTYGQTIE